MHQGHHFPEGIFHALIRTVRKLQHPHTAERIVFCPYPYRLIPFYPFPVRALPKIFPVKRRFIFWHCRPEKNFPPIISITGDTVRPVLKIAAEQGKKQLRKLYSVRLPICGILQFPVKIPDIPFIFLYSKHVSPFYPMQATSSNRLSSY